MNKNHLHFKIAKWSIQYPTKFYSIVGIVLIILISSLFVIGKITNKNQNFIKSVKTEQVAEISNKWIIKEKTSESKDHMCLLMESKVNKHLKITCYKIINGNLVFDYNI